MTVGIIGSGHLIRHMIPTLIWSGSDFLVSERNAAVSAELAARYGVQVEADNQAIVDACETVILAVRPYDAVAVATPLTFRDDQTVLSLCAGVASAELGPAVAPARLVMAMPVVAAQYGESPTLLWPRDETCEALLSHCGPVIALDDEAQFGPATAIACYYGWVHALIATMAGWTASQGVPPETARLLVAQMTRAAATMVREAPQVPIEALLGELATPRSFTLKGLEVLREEDAFEPWRRATEALFAKQP